MFELNSELWFKLALPWTVRVFDFRTVYFNLKERVHSISENAQRLKKDNLMG